MVVPDTQLGLGCMVKDSKRFADTRLQCIAEPKAVRDNCKAKAEWFSQEELAELEAAWVWAALLSILVGWLLAYIIVWILRWIRRGFQPSTLGTQTQPGSNPRRKAWTRVVLYSGATSMRLTCLLYTSDAADE